jgi:hypothetical protein
MAPAPVLPLLPRAIDGNVLHTDEGIFAGEWSSDRCLPGKHQHLMYDVAYQGFNPGKWPVVWRGGVRGGGKGLEEGEGRQYRCWVRAILQPSTTPLPQDQANKAYLTALTASPAGRVVAGWPLPHRGVRSVPAGHHGRMPEAEAEDCRPGCQGDDRAQRIGEGERRARR